METRKSMDWFLYDNDLRDERVKTHLKIHFRLHIIVKNKGSFAYRRTTWGHVKKKKVK